MEITERRDHIALRHLRRTIRPRHSQAIRQTRSGRLRTERSRAYKKGRQNNKTNPIGAAGQPKIMRHVNPPELCLSQ